MNRGLNVFVLILIITTQSFAYSQNGKVLIDKSKKLGEAKKSEIFEAPLKSRKHSPTGDLHWFPTLTSKVKAVDHTFSGDAEMNALKAEKLLLKTTVSGIDAQNDGDIGAGLAPNMSTNFAGNPNNGHSPMDNSIAISNDGIIVSVANTSIQYMATDGTITYANSIVDFIDDSLISYVCDPVVIYDAEEDRFIFFVQECSYSSEVSKLIILFSETNDPHDGWNYYKLTGNPLGDGSFFDYPKLAVSDTELFISGNLYFDLGSSYNQTVVYQMEKFDGYNGEPLTWQYWSDITADPKTLLPVSSGSNVNYGPGIYLVSTIAWAGSIINFYEITDAIAGSPTMDYYSVSTSSYELPGNAAQAGTSCQLSIGDCRCYSGFYMDGTVHFVFNSDVGAGWSGINYNRLNVSSLTNESNLFGSVFYADLAYPSIAWFGTSISDKSVLINYGSSGPSGVPQIRAVHVDNEGEWSESTLIKESDSYACFTSETIERWGDYTGAARRHNAIDPTVWINGMYGTETHQWNTWIAEIHANAPTLIKENKRAENLTIAPNPVIETFVLSFEATEDLLVEVNIISLDGRLVKHLYKGTAFLGENKFAFNKAQLASGTYFVQIKSKDALVANEKIVVH